MNEDEARQKLVEAAKANRIKLSDKGQRYFERAGVIKGDDADFTIVEAEIESVWGPYDENNRGGISIGWSTVSAGFGSLTLWKDKGGNLHIDREAMGDEFCLSVFKKLLETAKE